MTPLTWDRLEDRTFEAGVDKGVLYNSAGRDGVAWNGLISVTENPSEAEHRPDYQDGVKTYNRVTPHEYSSTIEAFTYPEEFEDYDGLSEYTSGVVVDEQIRKPFNLSYRTMVGDGSKGFNAGYKIHLLYNVLASPTNRGFASFSEAQSPTTFSWRLTTTPIFIPNYRPSSHFVVDSRRTGPLALANFERILYGWGNTNPRLPTPTQLYTHFEEWHVLYPSSSTHPSTSTHPGGP